MAINIDNTLHQRDMPLKLDNAKKYTAKTNGPQMCK